METASVIHRCRPILYPAQSGHSPASSRNYWPLILSVQNQPHSPQYSSYSIKYYSKVDHPRLLKFAWYHTPSFSVYHPNVTETSQSVIFSSTVNRLFSVLWYQPHTAELCHTRYAIFLAQLLNPSLRNAPLFRRFWGGDIFKHCNSSCKSIQLLLYTVRRMIVRNEI